MSRLRPEEIEEMFAEFGLARDEDRQQYRDLATMGIPEELREQNTRIDSTTDSPASENDPNHAKLA